MVLDDEVGRVVILDLRGRDPPMTLTGHPHLERLDLSPDRRWVATGTWQGNGVKVWDLNRGTLARDLAVEGSADVLFSPDGRSLVTASGDEYAIWDVGSWTPRLQLPRIQAIGLPGQAAFSPDGHVLAITTTRSLVQLVDAESGRELATLEPPEPKNISVIRFSPDGRSARRCARRRRHPGLGSGSNSPRAGIARIGLAYGNWRRASRQPDAHPRANRRRRRTLARPPGAGRRSRALESLGRRSRGLRGGDRLGGSTRRRPHSPGASPPGSGRCDGLQRGVPATPANVRGVRACAACR